MRRRVLLLTLLTAVFVALAVRAIDRRPAGTPARIATFAALPPLRPYDPAGAYVGPLRSNIAPPKVILGRDGIPLVRYPVGYRRNPVATAQYGLWAFAAGRPRVALREADWLLARQRPDGRWLYHFDFTLDGVRLRAPWSSAMAQGQAMSLLERAYRLTGRRVYLAAAIRALRPLRISVADGGLRRCFEHDCRFTWLEEYPTSSGSYVLNGFMFTLIGLYDLASVAPGSGAFALYEGGRRTLDRALPLYDHGGVASYDLADRAYVADDGYQRIHVYLLRTLDQLFPDAVFARYARRWAAGLRSSS